jgi:lipoprotein-anchoring transpeptidase ErfK/SrfK
LEAGKGEYVLHVDKDEFTLTVYDRQGGKVARYPVAIGKNPDGGTKLWEGDKRTPEGLYHVKDIYSMDAEKGTPARKKLARLNSIYFRASRGHSRYGHPDVDLGDNAYGPRFYALDYPNRQDRRRYEKMLGEGKVPVNKQGKPRGIGFGIAIHGNNDPGSIRHKASSGCIRMYNRDLLELDRYVVLQTPVLITP